MNILALDLGTKTGFARGSTGGGEIVSGVLKLDQRGWEGAGMRFTNMRVSLGNMHAKETIDLIAFEEVRAHSGTAAAHVYGGLAATVMQWCDMRGVPYRSVPVGTIKKYATGRGNARKQAIIYAMEMMGHTPKDDNEADALALLYSEMNRLGVNL